MKKVIIMTVLVLLLMEGISWWAYQSFYSPDKETSEDLVEVNTREQHRTPSENISEVIEEQDTTPPAPASKLSSQGITGNFEDFPAPSTEVINGRTERTIHMGVRQYVWEPATITAKKGELVRLIIHNADVLHGIVIPDLGVMEGDIPPEGAVIEFMASKTGTFEFFCSVWCGEGHMEMRGKIIIQ